MRTYIFACVHNAGRSQISAALFNQLADPAKARAISAGTEPAEHIHPVVVDVMREMGIDLARIKPQKLTAELAANAEMLITMGCGEACPFVPSLRREDWPLPDPKGKSHQGVRALCRDIERRVSALIAKEAVALLSPGGTAIKSG